MKQNLTCDCIAIDTNVFMHLFNPQDNPRNHINSLLSSLLKDNIKLLLDKEGEVLREYRYRLEPKITSSDDISKTRIFLKYCITKDNHFEIPVDRACELMRAISEIMTGKSRSDTVDKIFVYLVLDQQRILITNDLRDIINKRAELLDIVENDTRQNGARIYTSECAYEKMTFSNKQIQKNQHE